MREWCSRADFRSALPRLLAGEDPEFVGYIQALTRADDAVAGQAAER